MLDVCQPVGQCFKRLLRSIALGVRAVRCLGIVLPILCGTTVPHQHAKESRLDRLDGVLPTAASQKVRCGHLQRYVLAACVRLYLGNIEEHSRQLVVLFGRDRVDLVVVATGTLDCQGKERLTGRRHHVVEAVKLAVVWIGSPAQIRSKMKKHAQVLSDGGGIF